MSIKINVINKKRLEAINNLSKAVLNVSEALKNNTTVNITDCEIHDSNVGIAVESKEKTDDDFEFDETEFSVNN